LKINIFEFCYIPLDHSKKGVDDKITNYHRDGGRGTDGKIKRDELRGHRGLP